MNLREIDRLVAEHVFNHEIATHLVVRHPVPIGIYVSGKIDDLPHYSTSIEAAWEVVEKLKGLTFKLARYGDTWDAEIFGQPNSGFFLYAESAPLAICLCALKAKGIAVE